MIIPDDEVCKVYSIKELHSEVDFTTIPIISCFEFSNMISGKWVTKMFDIPHESLTLPSKNKFILFSFEKPEIALSKLHKSLIKANKSVMYLDTFEGKVSIKYLLI